VTSDQAISATSLNDVCVLSEQKHVSFSNRMADLESEILIVPSCKYTCFLFFFFFFFFFPLFVSPVPPTDLLYSLCSIWVLSLLSSSRLSSILNY
jgi:hypothetical protein